MNHFIGKQTIEIRRRSKKDAFEYQQSVSRMYRQEVLPALEKLFDRFSKADLLVSIDKLEIDLGFVSEKDFLKGHFIKGIIQQIEEQLIKSQYNQSATIKRIPTRLGQLDNQLFFLKNGDFPRFATIPKRDWQKKLLDTLGLNAVAANKFRNVLATNNLARKRLVLQHSPKFLSHIVELFTGQAQADLPTIFKGLKKAQQLARSKKSETISQQQVRQYFQKHFQAYLKKDKNIDLKVIQNLVKNQIPQSVRAFEIDFWETVLRLLFVGGFKASPKGYAKMIFQEQPSYQLLLPFLEILWQQTPNDFSFFENLFQQKGTNQTSIPPSIPNNIEDKSMETATKKIAAAKRLEAEAKATPKHAVNKIAASTNISPKKQRINPVLEKLFNAQHPLKSVSKTPNKQAEKELLTYEPAREAGWHLTDAGLVMLHPFITNLLENAGLTKEKKFKSDRHQQRALLLLHYLATGQSKPAEYELTLPKLLCGIPFQMPIDAKLYLRKKQKAEADKLLKIAIDHWGALGNVSPNALREGYLQREGKLTQKGNGWNLHVERKTLDILLNKLPWGLGIVRTPWMKEMLFVEWN